MTPLFHATTRPDSRLAPFVAVCAGLMLALHLGAGLQAGADLLDIDPRSEFDPATITAPVGPAPAPAEPASVEFSLVDILDLPPLTIRVF